MGPLPEQFVGKFKLEKSDNFDEYLAANGVNWLIRKLITKSNMTRVLSNVDESSFAHQVTTSRKDVTAKCQMGKVADFEQMDGKVAKVKYIMDGDKLMEELSFPDERPDDVRTFTIEGDYLVNVGADRPLFQLIVLFLLSLFFFARTFLLNPF